MSENGNGVELLEKVRRYSVIDTEMHSEEFDFTLRASVHDALWALSMQWKLNEFQGEDAGSTIYTRVHSEDTLLTRFKPGSGGVQAYNNDIPLEAQVEREKIAFDLALDLRFGNYWARLLKHHDIDSYLSLFLTAFPFPVPSSHVQQSNEQAMKVRSFSNHRVTKGGALLDFITSSGSTASALAAHVNTSDMTIPPSDYSALDAAISDYLGFYSRVFTQPSDDSSWKKNRLEYGFQSSFSEDANGSQTVLNTKEYHGGRLDWYNFDVKPGTGNSLPNPVGESIDDDVKRTRKLSHIPSPVTFPGMPHDRWWQMQDGNMNYGYAKPGKTGIIAMIAMDFISNYNNDWFLVPYPTVVGSTTNIRSIIAKDVFGDQIYVGGELTSPGDGDTWSIFKLNTSHDYYSWDNRLFVPPTLPRIMEGPNMDKVMFLRDQVANMVWAIESHVPDELYGYRRGQDAVADLRRYLKDVYPDLPSLEDPPRNAETDYKKASFRYLAMTHIPENWIPFIPQNHPTLNRVDFQRATLPRVMKDKDIDYSSPDNYVRPRTKVLREGLDDTTPSTYSIAEEEIPRAGVYVTRSYQRCRWHNGGVFLWQGRRKYTGRGEGLSGLAFDSLASEQDVTPPFVS